MKAADAGQALAVVLVDELCRCGVTDACLAPGSRSSPLAMALAAEDRIRLHVVIDERSASFLALGIAKASRRPVVLLCTSGTAAANFHPAVMEAHQSRTPLLVLTADRPPELRDVAANQTIDQIKLFGDAVRWFCEVGVPEPLPGSVAYWRSVGCRAVAEATGSPRGPVHLNLALREPLVPVAAETSFPHSLEGRAGGRPWTAVSSSFNRPRDSDIEMLAAEISATERGVVVAGTGTEAEPAPLLELARTAGWPVLAEASSGLRQGDNCISTYDALLRHEPFAATHRPDLVVRVGAPVLSRPLGALLDAGVRQVLIDADGSWLDPERALSCVIRGEPAATSTELCKALAPRRDSDWLQSWRQAERIARRCMDERLESRDEPSEPRTARDLAALLPHGATFVVGSSMPVRDLNSFMAPRPGVRFLANRGASGIDGFVSTVLGAALASDSQVYALAGDLSLLHDQNGLTLALRRQVDAVFVVVNNNGGGIFSFLPQARHTESFEKIWGTPHGLDFGKLAGLYECGYERINRASELSSAVTAARTDGGTHILEVQTDRAANVELHHELWEAVGRSLEPSL